MLDYRQIGGVNWRKVSIDQQSISEVSMDQLVLSRLATNAI
jgi:hypothetical protein